MLSVFTAIDKTITTSGSRDPLGFEALWGFLGGQIFDNRITSIANDARNYTLNLLHHSVVESLDSRGKLEHLRDKLVSVRPTLYDVRANVVLAAVTFLENLAAYAMATAGDSEQLTGLIGISKARAAIQSGDLRHIEISREASNFVLVNQLGVGLNGRYRTPFMRMQVFDDAYRYHWVDADQGRFWDKVALLAKSTPFAILRDALAALLERFWTDMGRGRYPGVDPGADSVNEVVRLYQRSFASPYVAELVPGIEELWKECLGLNSGAAQLLYRALGAVDHGAPISRDVVVHEALGTALQSSDSTGSVARSIQAISQSEPFLASARFAFDVLCDSEVRTIDHAVTRLESAAPGSASPDRSFVGRWRRLPAEQRFVEAFDGNAASENVRRRARSVSQLGESANDREFLQRLLSYHGGVVNARRGAPWVVEEAGALKRMSGVSSRPPATVYPWYHSYYLDSLATLKAGLEGPPNGK